VRLIDQVEALLFVADQPISVATLCDAAEAEPTAVEEALRHLSESYQMSGPIQLIRIAGGYQLATKAEFASVVTHFLKPQKQRLSKTVMEVLAVIAYQQPITIAEIEAVRGIQSDYGVRVLLEKRLIREVGRKQTPGRPVLYGTTQQFLHHFNLNDLSELPELALPKPQPALDFDGTEVVVPELPAGATSPSPTRVE